MATSAAPVVQNDPRAHDLVQEARSRTYHFPPDFAGFAASIEIIDSALGTFTGTTDIAGIRDVTVTTDAPEEVATWAKQQLASMAAHRWFVPYDQADGRWDIAFAEEQDHVQGQRVIMGDTFKSWYSIQEGQIRQVTREMGSTRFTITMQQHVPTADGHVLPAAFTVTYWDTGEHRFTRAESYTDEFTEIDGVYLPRTRRIDSASDDGLTARKIILSDIALRTPGTEPAHKRD